MKKLSMLIVLTLIISLLAACGSNNSGSNNKGDTAANGNAATNSGEKVSINYWHSLSGKNGEYMDALVKRFNDSHENIEVVSTFQGTYAEMVTKLQQAAASNTAPEVAMVERGMVELFANAEVLEDLNPYMEKSGMKADDFVAGLMGDSYYNDQLVALPFNRSTPIMHVNKTILDELGMDIPTTWEELKEVANAAVVKNGDEVTRYGLTMVYDTWYPIAMIQQSGGRVFDENKSTTPFVTEGQGNEVFTYLKDLQSTNALYYPPPADSGSIVNGMFSEGKVAILFQSTGIIGSMLEGADFDYQTAFLPQNDQFSNPTGGADLAMFNNVKNKDAAWEFMRWIMQDEEGATPFIVQTGYLPFTYSMVESDAIKNLWAEQPIRETAFKQLEYGNDTNKSVAWSAIANEMYSAIEAIMYDSEDIDKTLAEFQKNAERLLQE